MEHQQALCRARQLLDTHGLASWSVRLDHARQRCGSCHFKRREITLSRHFVSLNDSVEIEATVLHEIAHALAGPRAGHGQRWQQIAQRIGAPLQTTNDSAVMPEPAWGLRCVSCAVIVARRHRRSLKLDLVRCKHCGPRLGLLNWVRLNNPR